MPPRPSKAPAQPEAAVLDVSEPETPPEAYDDECVVDPAADLTFEKELKARKPVVPLTVIPATAPKETHLVVRANGTHMMGRPVLMETVSAAAVVNNLVCREELDPSGPLPPPSPTVLGLQSVVRAIAEGFDISPYRESIQRVAANQPEKSEVIRAYVNQVDHETLADLVVMRSHSIRVIKQASTRNDVTVGEALVIWSKCNEQIPELKKGIGTNDKAVDSVSVVEKIDYNKQQVERSVQHRWEGTTPQGRELIRKKLWEIKRKMLLDAGVHPPGMEPPEPPEDEPESSTLEHPLEAVTAANPP